MEIKIKQNKQYQDIAKKIIREELPELRDVKVAYLASQKEKKSKRKIVFAECVKVNLDEYGWCCPYDFMIIVYEPHVAGFTDEQMRILLLHELMHIGIDQDGEEPRYYVVPHDIEDFRAIIDRYGLDWQRGEDDAERREPEQ